MTSLSQYLQKESACEYLCRKTTDQSTGFYHHGLFRRNEDVFDLYHSPVLALKLSQEQAKENRITVELELAKLIGNADVRRIPAETTILLSGNRQWFFLHRDQFSLPLTRAREYLFTAQIRVRSEHPINIEEIALQKSDGISLEADRYSQAAEAGMHAVYRLTVRNESREQKTVLVKYADDGWKEMRPVLRTAEPGNVLPGETLHRETVQGEQTQKEERQEAGQTQKERRQEMDQVQKERSQEAGQEEIWLALRPGETKSICVEVLVSEKLAPGGYESMRILALPGGSRSGSAEITLQTGRRQPHPCVVFDAELLCEIREKINREPWAKAAYEKGYQAAQNWQPPTIDLQKDYLFDTSHAHHARDCAIIWQLSRETCFAEKTVAFLREWSDPDRGYLRLPRAGNQELVHDGEFFKSAATAYDLVYDWDGWTEEDRKRLEATMRYYMDYIDAEIQSGEASNWLLAEIAGAVYSAAVLEDRERMERFLYGPGGAADQLAKGVFDDGWWYEASIGYNLMCAGLFSELALAAAHFGFDFAHIRVNPVYRQTNCVGTAGFDGLVNDAWGQNVKNDRSIDMLWDSLIDFYDYRGVIMGINDSAEQKSNAQTKAFYKTDYELAYRLYRKPEYAYMISRLGDEERNLMFGEAKRPEFELERMPCEKSCYAENAGLAVLRSRKPGRPIREQIQVGLKYGSHGGAHGHYDRASMTGLMRYGKSLTNPENIWYSYHTFMYKFYCQTSINHNMVTVDLKQQEASEPKRLLFYSGDKMQVFGVQNMSRWSNPPYGGWPVGSVKTIEERQWKEGRSFPIPKDHPDYAARSGFTEPVLTRRVTVVTDDYVVNFDYGKSETPHRFQCMYHLQGLRGMEVLNAQEAKRTQNVQKAQSIQEIHNVRSCVQTGRMERKKHTEQLDPDPLGSAQFITDCDWYRTLGVIHFSFEADYEEKWNNYWKFDWKWQNRTAYNELGNLKTELYYIQPEEVTMAVASPPEFALVNKRLQWNVTGDQKHVLAQGAFGAWILGKERINVDISGITSLELRVSVESGTQGDLYEYESLNTIFWGDPVITTKDGRRIPMKELRYTTENTNPGFGPGVDYEGGRVMIQAEEFPSAIPAEPEDKTKPGIIRVDLSGLEAVRLEAVIGGDYPVGDESRKRRTVLEQQEGTSARFITLIEPHENESMIRGIRLLDTWKLEVELTNGRTQILSVDGLEAEGEETVSEAATAEETVSEAAEAEATVSEATEAEKTVEEETASEAATAEVIPTERSSDCRVSVTLCEFADGIPVRTERT